MDLSSGIEGLSLILKPLDNIGTDGTDHINTNKNASKSELGGMLDRSSNIEINHPNLGCFKRATNFFAFICHKNHCDKMRNCSALDIAKAKSMMVTDKNTKSLVVECVYYKIKGNKKLLDLVMANELELDYYWINRGVLGLRERPQNASAFVLPVEIAVGIIKSELDIDEFSSMNNRDIYQSFKNRMT